MRRMAFAVVPSIVRVGDIFRDRLSQPIDVAHRHVCLEKRNADARLLERLEDGDTQIGTYAHVLVEISRCSPRTVESLSGVGRTTKRPIHLRDHVVVKDD